MAAKKTKTMRVRIAVAVTEDERYNAIGWSDGRPDDDELAALAREAIEPMGLCEVVHFVEADVPVPGIPTIKGKVAQSNEPVINDPEDI